MSALDIPLYDRVLAARYLGVHPRTLDYWLDGDQRHLPVVRPERTDERSLTWGEFVECWYIVEYTRVHNTKWHELRAVLNRTNERYPLASRKYFSAPAGRLADLEGDGAVVLPADGQLGLPDVTSEFLRKVDFDEQSGAAKTIFPLGVGTSVRIEPTVSYGAPHVAGVRTDNIAELVQAGESVETVMDDFSLTVRQVEDALEFERVALAA